MFGKFIVNFWLVCKCLLVLFFVDMFIIILFFNVYDDDFVDICGFLILFKYVNIKIG